MLMHGDSVKEEDEKQNHFDLNYLINYIKIYIKLIFD